MLKQIKFAALSAADATGLSRIVLKSGWRRQKLLILCYHGISLEDEHQWNSSLYMSPELLQRRFHFLKNSQCNVLPLGEAIEALYAGKLPARAVAITFDDGFFDFYQKATQLALEFRFPVTVYLTTYYSYFNHPVFDPALNYLLWKGRGQSLTFPEAVERPVQLNDDSVPIVSARLSKHVTKLGYTGQEKNEFLKRLAAALKIDYSAFCEKRLLHLMTPEEVRKVMSAGFDVQLHTHRHRVSADKLQFQQEISTNRERIEVITNKPAQHFCYPSGFFLPEYAEWLREMKVESATTCVPGIATPSAPRFLLPRLVDTSTITETEFSGWVSGLASLLPRRKFEMDQGSLLRETLTTAQRHPEYK